MADFARWGTALAWAAGYQKHRFMDALTENSRRQIREVIQSDPLAESIKRLLADRNPWKGLATQLLRTLTRLTRENVRGANWPQSPNHLSRRLNELVPLLKSIGIEIQKGKSGDGRLIILQKVK
jgi:hypothetical protein